MPEDDSVPSAFDDLLDRALKGEEVDAEEVLRAHPEMPDDERRLIRQLCGSASSATGPATHPAPPHRLPFDRIGSHRILRRIGAGAMGAVFLAQDEALGREVAIKVLGPDILGTGERADRFLREVRAAARLRHPNIVTVHSAGEEDGLRYMVMELVPGRSLHELMAEAAARGTRIPAADVLRIGAGIGRALQAAHEAGIIHRDVKPSNVRIHEDGRAILLDFGLARDLGDATLTETGAFRGSPQYASPEQVDPAGRPIDARTDVYSLGATLYEMLTGVAPFRGETRAQLFQAILTREPVPPRRLDPAIPRDLETVVLAALDRDPARRHPSAAALADDLDAVRDGRPVSVRPPSPAGRAARWVRRHPARAALAAVLAIAIPAIAGLGGFVAANLTKIRQAEDAVRARAFADLLETSYVELGEGDPAGAERLFHEALQTDPASPEAVAGLVLAQLMQQNHQSARAVLDSLSPDVRNSSWARQLEASALFVEGRREDARALEASLPPPATAADRFLAGFRDLDRFHEGESAAAARAFDHLRAAVWLSPTPLYMSELGHAAMHAGRGTEALQIAAAIEALRPESPERWFAMGRTLRLADRPAAARALEKAARPPPRSLGARVFIVVWLVQLEPNEARLALAKELAAETLRADPRHPDALFAVGVAAAASGEREAALASLREAVRLRPSHVSANRQLHKMLLERGEVAEAIALARRYLAAEPRRWRAWDNLGMALMQIAEYEKAVEAFEGALRAEPDDPSLLCNLGTALVRSGRFAEALRTMRRGHEIGSKRRSWSHPSAEWVRECERAVALEARREEILQGAKPSTEERVKIARHVCRPKRLFAEAFELYASAFALDPSLPARTEPDYLLEAAAAGIHAGLGRAADSPADAAARAALRGRVLELLTAQAADSEDLVRDSKATGGGAAVADRAAWWLTEPELAAVGPRSDFAGIPEAEARAWRELWKRCDGIAPASRPASRPLLSR